MSTPSHFSLKFKPMAEILGLAGGLHLTLLVWAIRPSRAGTWLPGQVLRGDWLLGWFPFSTLPVESAPTRQHQQLTAVRGQPATPSPVDPATDCAMGTSGSKRPGLWPGSLESSQASLPPHPCSLLFFPPDVLTPLPDCDSQGSWLLWTADLLFKQYTIMYVHKRY